MKQFFKNAFTKIKDYFTANTGRKIFFFGLMFAAFVFIVFLGLRLILINNGSSQFFVIREILSYLRYFLLLAFAVAGVGTLWDSMQSRVYFLKKVQEIQYQHLKEIHDKQTAGEAVEMTPTFSDKEKKYLRRRKWSFILIILLKVALLIALFSLLLSM